MPYVKKARTWSRGFWSVFRVVVVIALLAVIVWRVVAWILSAP